MKKTTAELTNEYIQEHPYIKGCLKQGLINYSSLARLIAKELNTEKKTSMEAILIAARRFQEKLKKEETHENKIKQFLADSEIEIKNKIAVFVTSKEIDFDKISKLQKKIKEDSGTLFLLDGTNSYIIITQEKYSQIIKSSFEVKKETTGLALVNFKTSEEIEELIGATAYITSLFSENGVNIMEVISCWKDNVFVIKADDVPKAMNFLKF